MTRQPNWWVPWLAAATAVLVLPGCDASGLWSVGLLRRPAQSTNAFGAEQRRDPALSGNGRYLASIVETNGRSQLLLQEQPSGRQVPLRHLRGHQPHRSPSLSWNGRYVAVLLHQGQQPIAAIEDRLSGQLLRVPPPPGAVLERLSLAPDGQQLALQLVQDGQQRVQVFALSGQLEPDRPGGLRSSNPAP